MAIIGAYVMPHPPLAVPEVGGGRAGAIFETTQAMDEVAAEIARLKPDTIVFLTPHGTVYGDYFHISPGEGATGNFAQFGVAGAEFSAEYDAELVAEISRSAAETNFPAGTSGETDASLDHGVLVPMHFVNKRYTNYKTVRIALSGLGAAAHFKMGRILADSIGALKRHAVIIASGDLSHKLAEDGPYGYAPEGAVFDREIMKFLCTCDFESILSMSGELREKAAECGYGAFAVLAGCVAGANVSARKLSYEGPFGVGYGVVKYVIEDAYRSLARKSLEHRVKTGAELPFAPAEIPEELLSRRAGAFVSLHMNGQLRGCIGTIAPATDSVAQEIIRNAVSAGLYDNRFPPVHESELPQLSYKVDILDAPEEIPDESALDVKLYGVIVESGYKRGLLLPNLDGIDTVRMQVDIACQKAGISAGEKISLQRFKVTRYE